MAARIPRRGGTCGGTARCSSTWTRVGGGRYGELCGWALARAHARSGDAVAIGSYLGAGNTFDRAMCVFADGYADQNERDYEALRHAADAGRITVRTGL